MKKIKIQKTNYDPKKEISVFSFSLKNDIIENKTNNHAYLYIQDEYLTFYECFDCVIESENIEISNNNLKRYLYSYIENHETIFQNLFIILPNSSYSLKDPTLKRKSLFFSSSKKIKNYSHSDYIESLDSSLSKHSSTNNKIVVLLSGGLDSSSIAYVLSRRTQKKIVAMTWYTDKNDQDLLYAKRVCDNLGIEHLKLQVSPTDIFKKIESNIPARPFVSLFTRELLDKSRALAINYFGDENICFFDGHGGDHVFLEHLPFELIKYFIKNRKIKNIKHFMEIKNSNIFEITKNILFKKDITDIHREVLELAILDNTTPMFSKREPQTKYPFTDISFANSIIKIPYEKFFNHKEKRLFPKEAMFLFSRDDVFFRRDKGINTSVFQEALKVNRDRIEQLIDQGYLKKHGVITEPDIQKLKENVHLNSHGIGGINSFLAKVLATEILLETYYSRAK